MKLLIMWSSPASHYFLSVGLKYSPQHKKKTHKITGLICYSIYKEWKIIGFKS